MPYSWNFAQIIWDGRSTKVTKMMLVHWHLTFYGEVKFDSVCICMGPIHSYGKTVDNFKWLFLRSHWASVALITCRASLGQENERLLKWLSWMRMWLEIRRSRVRPPAEDGNNLSWRLIMKYFLRSFSPFRWFKKCSCQVLAKECAQYWLTA